MTEELNYEEKSYIREIYTKFAPYFHTLVSCASNGYLSASSSETDHYSHFIGGAMQALVAHSSTGILYRMPEWDLENVANLISVYFKELITPINLWYHEAEKKLDNYKGSSYISISFHVTVLVKSTFLSVSSGYAMSSVYSQNNYKLISMGVISAFASLALLRHFQNVEEQIIESVKNNNYYRVDALIRYRIPKEKIVDVIDILSKNIKCTEIEEMHCKSAIESALKLVDRDIDAKSTNASIKLAVSLALSIGKTSKISDEVLNKIEGAKAFSEIIEIVKDYLNEDKYSLEIKDDAINFLPRISDKVSGWHLLSNKIIEIASDVLRINDIKKMHDHNVEIPSPACKVNEESCKELFTIEDFKESNQIIEKEYTPLEQSQWIKIIDSAIDLIYKTSETSRWAYMPSDENGVTVLNNIVQYLLKLRELGLEYTEQVIKLHDSINNILYKCDTTDCKIKIVEKLLSSGKLKPISDTTISNIGHIDLYRKILEKFIAYDENKSESNVINKFASTILSNCKMKCVGHAMELFYKSGDFKNQIEPFKKDFPITKIVDKLLDDIDTKLLVDINNKLLINNIGSSTEKSSLEATIFKYLVSEVEATKQIQISIETDCIKKVEDKFHKAFYGDIYPTSNFSEGLLQDIEHCYDDDNSASITQNLYSESEIKYA